MQKVIVVAGGFSSEREISLITGKEIYKNLDKTKYNVSFLELKNKSDLKKLLRLKDLEKTIIFNALHGTFGEDGTFQGFLDSLGIKYTGCGLLSSALCMDKVKTKEILSKSKILFPRFSVLKSKDFKFEKKCVVKPCHQGSSVGVSIVEHSYDFKSALDKAFKFDNAVIVEEFIEGTEITCGILGDTPLPLIEIIPNKKFKFYDYKAKYGKGGSEHIIPARLTRALADKAQKVALQAYKALECGVYARVDMIVKGNKIYVLEVNTLPGMTPTSLLPQAAEKAGLSFSKLLDEIIELSLKK